MPEVLYWDDFNNPVLPPHTHLLIIQIDRDVVGDEAWQQALQREIEGCAYKTIFTERERFDGRVLGKNGMNLYILSYDPSASFNRVVDVLSSFGLLDSVRVAYRVLDGTEFFVLWPNDDAFEFEEN